MSETIMAEWHFWMVSIIAGAAMAFAYDLLCLFRRLVRHIRLFVDLEDILFWTVCFFASFTLLYYENNGVIRFAAVFGAGIGMLAYALTVGKFFVKCSYFVIMKLVRLLRILFRPIARAVNGIRRHARKSILFLKCRLTRRQIHHTINLVHASKALENRKGDKGHGRKGKKKKNPKVPPRQK